MRLPTEFPKADAILKKLGFPYHRFIDPETRLTLHRSGKIVEIDQIGFADDGTLEYQGQKVILYIRDVMGNLPKYHVMNCRTLVGMRRSGKYKRYVVTRRTDGEFLLNFSDNLSRDTPETYRLDICKNCLWHELNLRGVYTPDAFPLKDWLNAIDHSYQPPPIDGLSGPRTTPVGAVSNYPPDWKLLSLQCRQNAGWKCQECTIDLKDNHRFLHTHHIRGTRYNRPEDLKALCIRCHAEQPGQGHNGMKNMPDYQEFLRLYK